MIDACIIEMIDACIIAFVVPAEAGTRRLRSEQTLDSRLRGNDAGDGQERA